jgi:hypothetical protein
MRTFAPWQRIATLNRLLINAKSYEESFTVTFRISDWHT